MAQRKGNTSRSVYASWRAAMLLVVFSIALLAEDSKVQVKALREVEALKAKHALIETELQSYWKVKSVHADSEKLAWQLLPWTIAGAIGVGFATGYLVSIINPPPSTTRDILWGVGAIGVCGIGIGVSFTVWIGEEQRQQKNISERIKRADEEQSSNIIAFNSLMKDINENTGNYFDMADEAQRIQLANLLLKTYREPFSEAVNTEAARKKFVRVIMKMSAFEQANGDKMTALNWACLGARAANKEELSELDIYKSIRGLLQYARFSSYSQAAEVLQPYNIDAFKFGNLMQLEGLLIFVSAKVVQNVGEGQYILSYERGELGDDRDPYVAHTFSAYIADANKCPVKSIVDEQIITLIGAIEGTSSYLNILGSKKTVPKMAIYAIK